MMSSQPKKDESVKKTTILYSGMNADGTCITVGTEEGFGIIYNPPQESDARTIIPQTPKLLKHSTIQHMFNILIPYFINIVIYFLF